MDRAVKKGDTADIDFEGFDNGVAFDGGKGENFDLEIGSGSFVPGFEDQLIGMKAGEEKDIDITFPENYTLSWPASPWCSTSRSTRSRSRKSPPWMTNLPRTCPSSTP